VVRIGAVIFALGRGEDYFGHASIIDATAIIAALGSLSRDNKGMKVKTQSKKVNKAWLNDHVNDTYVKLAKQEGYRARAAYKIKEIDDTLGLIKPGYCVVDLGSAPGAWSQYVRRRLSPVGAAVGALNGRIIALDLLPMDPVEGVVFIQGDFREDAVLSQLEQALDQTGKVDVVISDMAPNLSGIGAADAARISHLVELAVEFAQKHLKSDGALVVKLFHGDGYSDLVKLFKSVFRVVKPIKPKASRPSSSETFLIGVGLKEMPSQSPAEV
jgi:23S rRNA (uridine2552-2'-O)-methyltransferase